MHTIESVREWGRRLAEEKNSLGESLIAIADSWQAALASQPQAPSPAAEPIDIVLHCPACGLQHIDAPRLAGDVDAPPQPGEGMSHEEAQPFIDALADYEASWTNPPHRSHLCHGCGHTWRPSDVPTNGVQAVKTKGKNDSPELTDLARVMATQRSVEADAPLINGLTASEPVKPMDEDELQDFCVSLSFEQDDYTVEVIRAVEDRMRGVPLFVPAKTASVAGLTEPCTESAEWCAEARKTLDHLSAFLQRTGAPHYTHWQDWIDSAERHLMGQGEVPAEPSETTCNCRWRDGRLVQQCTLHEAHRDAIHDWARRAKDAERKLAAMAHATPPARDAGLSLTEPAAFLAEVRKLCAATTQVPAGTPVAIPDSIRAEMLKFMRDEPSAFDRLPHGEVVSLGNDIAALAAAQEKRDGEPA